MQKSYKIEVDCANCANLMEETANKVEGVEKANVSFITQKMKIKFKEGYEEKSVMQEILNACRAIESDCEIEF